MRLVLTLALGILACAGLSAGAAPVDPGASQQAARDARILHGIRLKLLSPAARDAALGDRLGLWLYYATSGEGPLWVARTGWTPRALAVIREIERAGDWGLDPDAFEVPALPPAAPFFPDIALGTRADAEMRLSLAILKYARYARGGRIESPARQLSSYLDRVPQVRLPWRVMAEIAGAAEPGTYLRGLNPRHAQFERLRQQYLARRAAGAGDAFAVPESGTKLAPGSSHRDIPAIRRRLGLAPPRYGDETVYDDALAEAVKAFQRKKEISPVNGIINWKTRRALNAGSKIGVKAILANMEQWRWMPEHLGKTFVWVNVPEFKLRVIKDGRVLHEERVITGETDTQTPIFSESLKTIYFHPRWFVPESIKVNTVGPSLRRGGGYFYGMGLRLLSNGREINPRRVNWSKADIRNFDVYQPPGPGNALGRLKFIFPNKHAVYMHDTPQKGLFNASLRTFSHGCIRVRDPVRLAEVLLSLDRDWHPAFVGQLLKREGHEHGIELATRIPVHVTYFTVQVDDDGELSSYPDPYGHEKRIALALEGKWKQIAKGRDHLAALALDQEAGERSRPRRASTRSSHGIAGSGRRSRSRASAGRWSPAGPSRSASANDIFRMNWGY